MILKSRQLIQQLQLALQKNEIPRESLMRQLALIDSLIEQEFHFTSQAVIKLARIEDIINIDKR